MIDSVINQSDVIAMHSIAIGAHQVRASIDFSSKKHVVSPFVALRSGDVTALVGLGEIDSSADGDK